MIPVRKAMGMAGERYGELSSHGKARFSMADPGRDAVVGLTAVMKVLRDDLERIKQPIDQMHAIIEEEFEGFVYRRFLEDMTITKSYAFSGTEINYENTWKDGEFGIPNFTLEDMFANTNPIM